MENMNPEAVGAWNRFVELYGRPLNINSSYRDPEHNARVGGAKNSQHIHGNAFDVDVSGMPIPERQRVLELAREAGFSGFGLYDNSLHFDVGPARAWGADYTSASLPDWWTGGNAPEATQNALTAPVDRMAQINALAAMMPKFKPQQQTPFQLDWKNV